VSAEVTEIREFREADLDAVVELSLRAWEPVYDSIRQVLGDRIFLRLHPDWKANQAEAVRSSCTSEERDVFVAVAEGRPVGFVAMALNAFHDRMGVIDIIGVRSRPSAAWDRFPADGTRDRAPAALRHGHRGRRDRWRLRARHLRGR
jgi:hypothetical protein